MSDMLLIGTRAPEFKIIVVSFDIIKLKYARPVETCKILIYRMVWVKYFYDKKAVVSGRIFFFSLKYIVTVFFS